MPPYTAVVSDAQRRKLFALARRGDLSMAEAAGKAHAAKGRDLPERVSLRHLKRKAHGGSHA
jgi:hypothetical protein